MCPQSTIRHVLCDNKTLFSFIDEPEQLHQIMMVNFWKELHFPAEFILAVLEVVLKVPPNTLINIRFYKSSYGTKNCIRIPTVNATHRLHSFYGNHMSILKLSFVDNPKCSFPNFHWGREVPSGLNDLVKVEVYGCQSGRSWTLRHWESWIVRCGTWTSYETKRTWLYPLEGGIHFNRRDRIRCKHK